MVSCTRDGFSSIRLRCFKGVKDASERTSCKLMNQLSPVLISKRHSVSLPIVSLSCSGRMAINKRQLSMMHVLYVTEQLIRMSYTGWATKVVLLQ